MSIAKPTSPKGANAHEHYTLSYFSHHSRPTSDESAGLLNFICRYIPLRQCQGPSMIPTLPKYQKVQDRCTPSGSRISVSMTGTGKAPDSLPTSSVMAERSARSASRSDPATSPDACTLSHAAAHPSPILYRNNGSKAGQLLL